MAAATTEPKTTVPVKAEERRPNLRDPFDMIDELWEEMARLWGHRPLFRPRPALRPFAPFGETEWAPRVDVYEKNGNLVVKAELPGVTKEDVKVEMQEGNLIITGERKSESEVKEADYYRMERAYGTFYRRLPIPFEVKPEQITATYKDGVLEIEMPRPAEAAPETKQIPVS
jgi:HSP20 family protein